MTTGHERKVETRFARRSAAGKGIGIDEAIAAAEARIDGMREGALQKIGEMLTQMQAALPAIAQGDGDALRLVHEQADALVGLCGLFGLPNIEKAAVSLCKLYDACQPDWPAANGVRVHIDAVQLFWALPEIEAALAGPQVLEGLRQVAVAARRRPSMSEHVTKASLIPPDEVARLSEVKRHGLVADSLNAEMADLLSYAQTRFSVQTALISIVERDRQVFAARAGLNACETHRDVSFCGHALEGREILLVPDASMDRRFSQNALVTGDPFIRFYAGVPIRPGHYVGSAIGTICIIDPSPRDDFSTDDAATMFELATLVMNRLETRLKGRFGTS